jgi:hypothetical protein
MLGLMNDQTKATDLEVEAMLNGSLFGWDTPGADPKHLAPARQRSSDQRSASLWISPALSLAAVIVYASRHCHARFVTRY